MKELLRRIPERRLIRVACYLASIALVLMIWSVLTPDVVPILLAMSVGQGLGIVALLCYLLAILSVVRKHDA